MVYIVSDRDKVILTGVKLNMNFKMLLCDNDVPSSITQPQYMSCLPGLISIVVDDSSVNPNSIVIVKWFVASELTINFDRRNIIKYVIS